MLTFDLADAKIAAPPNVASISARADTDTSAVDLTLIGDADVHSFRDEKNYIVDVAIQQNEQQSPAKGHRQLADARAARQEGRGGNRAGDVGSHRARGQDRDQAGTGEGRAAATRTCRHHRAAGPKRRLLEQPRSELPNPELLEDRGRTRGAGTCR